ncbi:hypothetical protein GALL_55380 [mine drainage metagenome]|uniref:Uncharacterized protein n=1 Tax=mine drainage metagenome TaxID=410659 RepID=A0A1J5SX58_9ZZZZ
MKTRTISFLFILTILSISCNKIPKDKITIIDNYVLGGKANNFVKEMDSLAIKHARFTRKTVFTSYNEITDENNFVNAFFTNAFNLSDFKNSYNDNVGIYYSLADKNKQNIIGIILLLGHTNKPQYIGEVSGLNNSLSDRCFYQDINKNLFQEIVKLYANKYGNPIESEKNSSDLGYYIMHNNSLILNPNFYKNGKYYTWINEYIRIDLFTGIPSATSLYNSKGYLDVIASLGGDSSTPLIADSSKNEAQCNSYGFIKYTLTDKAIKLLKLDSPAINEY